MENEMIDRQKAGKLKVKVIMVARARRGHRFFYSTEKVNADIQKLDKGQLSKDS